MTAPATIGILPPGALAAGFFADLTAGLSRLDGDIVFLAEPGSASVDALRAAGVMNLLRADGETVALPTRTFVLESPAELVARGEKVPSVILVAVNTDRVTRALAAVVDTAEALRSRMSGSEETPAFPAFVFCANGIYHAMARRLLDERLEESVAKGKLTPEDRFAVNASLLRGVSYQSGSRSGSGSGCIYVPGPTLGTRVCGESSEVAARTVALLRGKGGRFETPEHGDPLRAEFDKAAMNLVVNSWGVVLSVADSGAVAPLTMGDIARDHRDVIRETLDALYAIGRAMRVYPPEADAAAEAERLAESLLKIPAHVSSSVAAVAREATEGRLSPGLPSSDEAYLRPLARYANYAGLARESAYFEDLAARLEAAVARAAGR